MSASPVLSVIIPTHERFDVLKHCLEHLSRQTIANQLEVIVVSDGHDEKTTRLFVGHSASGKNQEPGIKNQEWPFPVHFFEIKKSHQGAARNEGVRHASGEIVLFIGDDILLAPDACERHLTAHRGHKTGPIAVLGFTTWDPNIGVTPIMRWLERSGWQFGYPCIAQYGHGLLPVDIQHQYSYTSHISVSLSIAKNVPFRTDVHLYGWEDIEWGTRLRDAGVRMYYEPHARALHEHPITLQDSLRRMEELGQSVVQLEKLVPGFDRRPRAFKLFLYRIAALFPTIGGLHRKAFLRGIDKSKIK